VGAVPNLFGVVRPDAGDEPGSSLVGGRAEQRGHELRLGGREVFRERRRSDTQFGRDLLGVGPFRPLEIAQSVGRPQHFALPGGELRLVDEDGFRVAAVPVRAPEGPNGDAGLVVAQVSNDRPEDVQILGDERQFDGPVLGRHVPDRTAVLLDALAGTVLVGPALDTVDRLRVVAEDLFPGNLVPGHRLVGSHFDGDDPIDALDAPVLAEVPFTGEMQSHPRPTPDGVPDVALELGAAVGGRIEEIWTVEVPEHAVDLRGVPPEKRRDRVREAFEGIGSGERFEVVSDRNPGPVREFLEDLIDGKLKGFRVKRQNPDTWRCRTEKP